MSEKLNLKSCSLWFLAAVTDVKFLEITIPHLVRMSKYPFVEKVIAIDTKPLSGHKTLYPDIGSIRRLFSICDKLKKMGVVDAVYEIDYSKEYRQNIYKKHFNFPSLKATHNYKGYPVLGSIFSIDMAKGEYFLHYDSDMMLHQREGFSWVEKGIKILEENPEVLWVRPQSGPQGGRKNIYLDQYKAERMPAGYYRLNDGFASRCFLIHKKRFESILPMDLIWNKKQGRIKDRLPRYIVEAYNNLTGKGLVESWELIVGKRINEKNMARADIADNNAWTLHPKVRGENFVRRLPGIISGIEKGWYPPEQEGLYDLEFDAWDKALTQKKIKDETLR